MEAQESQASTLEARRLGRRLPEQTGWLFRRLSLRVEPADRIALVGPTGSGKTLLLRALAMLDPLDEGQVVWRGEAISGSRVPWFRAEVMYLHQTPVLFPGTVEANLRQPLELHVHRRKRFDRERIVQMLSRAGRDAALLDQPAETLSGGERQTVALLRAMQLDPLILLLDEPTAALDAASARAIERLVANWHAERDKGRAYVWVSHSQEQMARVADRRLNLEAGTLLEENVQNARRLH